ncbi:MAG: apolipoprotein N-acyltransferase [Pseudomonadota bacterium]
MQASERAPLHPLGAALISLLAGGLITLSLAPYAIWPAGILSCAIYAWLLSTCSTRTAIWRGFLFGLGMFGSGVSWVYVSIHVHGNAAVPLAAILTAAFCAGLALLQALFAAVYVRLVRPLPGGMLLGFACLWVLFEWLRSWLLTGFPWLYLGNAHIDTWLAGWAPVVGVFGLSLVTALTGSCLFLAWRSRAAITLTTYGGILLTLWVGGAFLKPIEWVAAATPEPVKVAIYQPNIPQAQKWDKRFYRPILDQFERAMAPLYGTDIVVWPESAIPNFYQRAELWLAPIEAAADSTGTALITGIPYLDPEGSRYFNSIMALGQGRGVYHKQRLVPFGEYVPLESFLRGLIDFFDLPMSAFSAGERSQAPLRAGALRIAPFICYEIVYPDLVASYASQADLFITISNDSWFGESIGPLQHLQIARMRALENGRYLIRGTNNGVSALINHRGEVIAASDQFVETTLFAAAEPMLGSTPFASLGSRPVLLGCALALLSMFGLYRTFWREP